MFGKDKDSKEVKVSKKEEKAAKKEQELMEKYGLDGLMDPFDRESVKNIARNITANNLMLIGAGMQFKSEEVSKISLLQTLIEQNWIIIRQLDKLNSKQ